MSYIIAQRKDEHDNETAVITVYLKSGKQVIAADSHPNYKKIVIAAIDGDDDQVEELYDAAASISKAFNRLTERITVSDSKLYVDGDVMDDSLANQIIRFLDEGLELSPLVNFLEKILANPNEHSRTQAWDWLRAHDFTITDDGDIIGYKGVYGSHSVEGYEGVGTSSQRGHAIVDGVEMNGYIPYPVGAVVEMPRSEVMHDPRSSCSAGLHVGTFEYAKSYAKKEMIEVLVNPRDIVSVPTDGGGGKVRVCRLKVVGPVTKPHDNPLRDKLAEKPAQSEAVGVAVKEKKPEAETTQSKAQSTSERVLRPTESEFTVMLQRAHRRRRNFPKYAAKMSAKAGQAWTLVNPDDPKNRLSWTKEKKA